MKNEKNTKLSNAMKLIWATDRERMMLPRKEQSKEIKEVQGAKIRQHFREHPEHRAAISDAQKHKWFKYKKALAYCINNNVNLGDEL